MSSAPDEQRQAYQNRVAAQAAARFLLDQLNEVSRGLQLIDSLLLMTVLQANISQITADRDLQLRFAAVDDMPPDELRRPISITAIAASLNLPFETIRRRMGRLAAAHLCEQTGRGYRVPGRVLRLPRYRGAPGVIYSALGRLYGALSRAGCLDEPLPSSALTAERPIRIANRFAGEYFLRLSALITERAGDPIDAFILLTVFHLNAEDCEISPARDWDPDQAFWKPSGAARVAHVAQRLTLPAETVRRRLLRLQAAGVCQNTAKGWDISTAGLRDLRFEDAMGDNSAHLRHLFANLARFGVVNDWPRT